MEAYTKVHKENRSKHKAIREVECLKVLFPRLFRSVESDDLIAGRLDFCQLALEVLLVLVV